MRKVILFSALFCLSVLAAPQGDHPPSDSESDSGFETGDAHTNPDHHNNNNNNDNNKDHHLSDGGSLDHSNSNSDHSISSDRSNNNNDHSSSSSGGGDHRNPSDHFDDRNPDHGAFGDSTTDRQHPSDSFGSDHSTERHPGSDDHSSSPSSHPAAPGGDHDFQQRPDDRNNNNNNNQHDTSDFGSPDHPLKTGGRDPIPTQDFGGSHNSEPEQYGCREDAHCPVYAYCHQNQCHTKFIHRNGGLSCLKKDKDENSVPNHEKCRLTDAELGGVPIVYSTARCFKELNYNCARAFYMPCTPNYDDDDKVIKGQEESCPTHFNCTSLKYGPEHESREVRLCVPDKLYKPISDHHQSPASIPTPSPADEDEHVPTPASTVEHCTTNFDCGYEVKEADLDDGWAKCQATLCKKPELIHGF